MPSSSTTTPYSLPQYSANDYPSFTQEITAAFKTINDTMKLLNDSLSAAQEAAENAQASASTAQQAANAAQQAADNVVALMAALGITNEEQATAFKALVDNAVPKYNIKAEFFNTL